MNAVENYIENNWEACIKEKHRDNGTLIGLPYPYTVPAVGHFDEMYYWDTYFLNQGLKISGRHQQMKNNTDNMIYMVDKFGFVLNGNRTQYLKNSQPPFLSEMVRDVYEYYKDRVWLQKAYKTLEKEYSFWMENRITSVGLNQYSFCGCSQDDFPGTIGYFEKRLGISPDLDNSDKVREFLTMCESGWDMNPRWGFEGVNFVQIDLNSLMYQFEKNMAYFSSELENGHIDKWEKCASGRKELVNKYMLDENGLFFDYNFKKGELGKIFSVASYYPMYVGLADEVQAKAAADNLFRLEEEFGVVTCVKNDVQGVFQWDYPNGWACLQHVMTVALNRYGFVDEAKRIAQKYVALVERNFETTGNIWEKYNVVEGNIKVASLSKMPPMMGWTAGSYLALKKYLEEGNFS